MRKTNVLLSVVVLLCSITLFTACKPEEEKPDYAKLLLGDWLYIDENETDDSFVMNFTNQGKLVSKYGAFVDDVVGYRWIEDDGATYKITDEVVEIGGTFENKTLSSTAEIVSLKDDVLTIKVVSYTLDGQSVNEQLGTVILKKVKDNYSLYIGTWKVTLTNDLVNYYDVREDKTILCYEEDENGEWQVYEYEEFFCYGNFFAWFWKDANSPDAYTFYEGFVAEKVGNNLKLTNYSDGVTDIAILEAVDPSEIPAK